MNYIDERAEVIRVFNAMLPNLHALFKSKPAVCKNGKLYPKGQKKLQEIIAPFQALTQFHAFYVRMPQRVDNAYGIYSFKVCFSSVRDKRGNTIVEYMELHYYANVDDLERVNAPLPVLSVDDVTGISSRIAELSKQISTLQHRISQEQAKLYYYGEKS